MAVAAAIVAFACYRATLLPGLDFGDSASFQTGVGSLTLTPRQAYPLYYALGNVVAWLDPREPAHAMNLASAIYGAAAVGIAALVAAELCGSLIAGLAAGLLLAFSYTFWSQAITAEVYTLHLLVAGASMLALLAWEKDQSRRRLAVFYAIYALGFGNHLSMILMLPGFVLFLLMARRHGDGDPLLPRNIVMAVVIAALGSLQYAWNFRALWWELEPPASMREALAAFWFDVTKSDWRETIVMGVSESGLRSRPAMYWWDVRQQFGVPGVALAVAGFVYVAARWPRRALLLASLYAAALAFAWTYNVGDAYIFFLPSHYIIALSAGAGVACLLWLISSAPKVPAVVMTLIGVCSLLYPLWRAYDDFPALDRGHDNRALGVLDQMTSCADSVLGLDGNWQVQNAVEYYMRERKPHTPWFTTADLKWLSRDNPGGFARLVNDNDRPVVVTAAALRTISRIDSGVPPSMPLKAASLTSTVAPFNGDAFYAFAVLRPDPEFPIDRTELESAWMRLTNGAAIPATADYAIAVGRIGSPPQIVRTDGRPFRIKASIAQLSIDVRMESWLPTDTIRRSGFGHVIVKRTHLLTIERGISLLVFDAAGHPLVTAYHAGLFAPVDRSVFLPAGNGSGPCYR